MGNENLKAFGAVGAALLAGYLLFKKKKPGEAPELPEEPDGETPPGGETPGEIPDGKLAVKLVNFPAHKAEPPPGFSPDWYGGAWLAYHVVEYPYTVYVVVPEKFSPGVTPLNNNSVLMFDYYSLVNKMAQFNERTVCIDIELYDHLWDNMTDIKKVSAAFEPQNKSLYTFDVTTGLVS